MTAGLNLHILVVLCTDLTQLESGAHLTVQLILLLGGGNETTMSLQCLSAVTSYGTLTPPEIIMKGACEFLEPKFMLTCGGVFFISTLLPKQKVQKHLRL